MTSLLTADASVRRSKKRAAVYIATHERLREERRVERAMQEACAELPAQCWIEFGGALPADGGLV